MKKQQKEQAQIILKDINGAIKSWLEPIKEEQQKLFDLIRDNNKQEENYKNMYYGKTEKVKDYYTKWGETQQYFKLLQIAEKYYTKQFKNICGYINNSIYLLTILLCETKKDFQDLLHMVDYESNENLFYITFDKRHLTFDAHLRQTFESLTSCLYVSEKLYTYNSLLDTQLLEEDYKNNNYHFNKLEDKQLLKLSNDLQRKRANTINKLNESLKNININNVMLSICNINNLLKEQEKAKEEFINKQKEELNKQDNLNIASYFDK